MVFLLLGGQTLLDLLPVCLGGSHGVVAVTDCVGEERLRVRAPVLRVEGLAVAQRLQTALDRVGVLALRNEPAGDVAAVLHEVGIIQLGEGAGLFEQRLDDPAVGVVDEDHDVRQLEAGALAHLQTGRDALDDRLFGRADKGRRAGGVLVGLQIDREHDAAARRRAAGPAFGQYRAGRQGTQRAVLHVLLHGLVDALDMGRDVCVLEIDLRQGQTQRRRCVADDAVGLCPVFGLRGVLVAGDDRPFGQVGALAGHHDFGNSCAAICHWDSPPYRDNICF